ncbi:MAG: class I SAM-dependent methyltransferase [bacterium]
MSDTAARLQREKEFHDSRFGGDDSERAAAEKYYSIMERALGDYRERALAKARYGHLLEYGCATGLESLVWLKGGARVTGIDISGEAIEKAAAKLQGTGYQGNATYLEMNAEQMDFPDDSFDVVVGNGIIHHLDLDVAYREIARVLKPNGSAVFIEPTGHNFLINTYRRLTPAMRTEDEHPLMMSDIALAQKYFGRVESAHYNLFSLLAVPFRGKPVFQPLLKGLHSLDQAIFKVPGLKKLGWTVVMELSEPHESG